MNQTDSNNLKVIKIIESFRSSTFCSVRVASRLALLSCSQADDSMQGTGSDPRITEEESEEEEAEQDPYMDVKEESEETEEESEEEEADEDQVDTGEIIKNMRQRQCLIQERTKVTDLEAKAYVENFSKDLEKLVYGGPLPQNRPQVLGPGGVVNEVSPFRLDRNTPPLEVRQCPPLNFLPRGVCEDTLEMLARLSLIANAPAPEAVSPNVPPPKAVSPKAEDPPQAKVSTPAKADAPKADASSSAETSAHAAASPPTPPWRKALRANDEEPGSPREPPPKHPSHVLASTCLRTAATPPPKWGGVNPPSPPAVPRKQSNMEKLAFGIPKGLTGSRQKTDIYGRVRGRGGANNKNTAWFACLTAAQNRGPRTSWWFRMLHPKPGDKQNHANWMTWLQDTGAWPTNFSDGSWKDLLPEEWRPKSMAGIYGPQYDPKKTRSGHGWDNAWWKDNWSSSSSRWQEDWSSSPSTWRDSDWYADGASSSAGPSNPNEEEPDWHRPDFVPSPAMYEYKKGSYKRKRE